MNSSMNNLVFAHNSSRIILSHERRNRVTLDIYPARHLLTYIREGVLKVRYGKEVQCFSKGDFVMFRKHSPVTITKTWQDGEVKFSSIVFTFQEDIVRQALEYMNIETSIKGKSAFENVLAIETNSFLKQFIHSLHVFFDEGIEMNEQLAKLKTMEALVGIIRTREDIVSQLQDFSVSRKADLHKYMNFHFLENKKLADFAAETGRSLSVFKRDFQSLYSTTPAKWLKRKRLEHAYEMMKNNQQRASEIYLKCGFEDLAHFSRSFKAQFGFTPSQITNFLVK